MIRDQPVIKVPPRLAPLLVLGPVGKLLLLAWMIVKKALHPSAARRAND